MSEEIKTGWLKERDGTKFAPKTLISQVVTNDGYNYDQVVKAQMSNLKNELGANTKEDIAALQTSLNALQDKVDNISLDELVSADNRLYIVDNEGYKIAEIDAEGIHSVNFIIPESGDLKSLTEVLDIVDDKTFYIVDDNGFKIFEINSSGAHSVDFLINGKSVKDSLASILTDISGLREAINNVFTSESDKSIEIVDGKENIIVKIDSAGVHSVDFTAYKAKEKVEGAEGTEYDTLTLWEVNDIINDVKQEIEEVKQTITSNDVIEQLQKDVDALETTTSGHGDQLKIIDEKIDLTDTPEESFDIVDKNGYKIASFDKTGLSVTNLNVGGNGDDVGTISADKVNAGNIELSELGNKSNKFIDVTYPEDKNNINTEINGIKEKVTAISYKVNEGTVIEGNLKVTDGLSIGDYTSIDKAGNISTPNINATTKITSPKVEGDEVQAGDSKLSTLGVSSDASKTGTAFERIEALESATTNENSGLSALAQKVDKNSTDISGLKTKTQNQSAVAGSTSFEGNVNVSEKLIVDTIETSQNEWIFVDDKGNKIATIDENGLTTTKVTAGNVELTTLNKELQDYKMAQGTTDSNQNEAINKRLLTSTFDNHLNGAFKEVNDKTTTLIGNDTKKSVREIATEIVTTEVSKVVDNAPEAWDTLKEVADWIEADNLGTAALIGRVSTLETKTQNQTATETKTTFTGNVEIIGTLSTDNIDIGKDEWIFADTKGNEIVTIDGNGLTTTKVTADTIVADEISVSKAAATSKLSTLGSVDDTKEKNTAFGRIKAQEEITTSLSTTLSGVKKNVEKITPRVEELERKTTGIDYAEDKATTVVTGILSSTEEVQVGEVKLSTLGLPKEDGKTAFERIITLESTIGSSETGLVEKVNRNSTDIEGLKSKTQNQSATGTKTSFTNDVEISGTLIVEDIEVGKDEWAFVDDKNNIVATINENGLTTTKVTAGEVELTALNKDLQDYKSTQKTLNDGQTEEISKRLLTKTYEAHINGEFKSVSEDITTLIGDDTDKSVKEIATEVATSEVAKVVDNAPDDWNTLKKIADWIEKDETDTSVLVGRVNTLETKTQNQSATETKTTFANDVEVTGTLSVGDINVGKDEWIFADTKGNKIATIDDNGLTTTKVTAGEVELTALNKELQDYKIAQSTVDSGQNEAIDKRLLISAFNSHLNGAFKGVNDKTTILVGSDTDKSVRTIATEVATSEVAKVVDNAPEAMNTLKEVAEWITKDETGTSALIDRVRTLEAKTQNQSAIEIKTSFTNDVEVTGTLSADNIEINKDEWVFADAKENIIATINENGLTTTKVTANTVAADEISVIKNGITSKLSTLGSTSDAKNTNTAFGRVATLEDTTNNLSTQLSELKENTTNIDYDKVNNITTIDSNKIVVKEIEIDDIKLSTLGKVDTEADTETAFGRIKILEDSLGDESSNNTVLNRIAKIENTVGDSESGLVKDLIDNTAQTNQNKTDISGLIAKTKNQTASETKTTFINDVEISGTLSVEDIEIGKNEWVFTDDKENIIATINANGLITTKVTAGDVELTAFNNEFQEYKTAQNTLNNSQTEAIDKRLLTETYEAHINGEFKTISNNLKTLIGEDTNQSVRDIVADEVIDNAPTDLNTLKKIAERIEKDEVNISALIDKTQNQTATETKTVFEADVDIAGTLSADNIEVNKEEWIFADNKENIVATINENGLTSIEVNVGNSKLSTLGEAGEDNKTAFERITNIENTYRTNAVQSLVDEAQDSKIDSLIDKFTPFEESFEFEEDVENLEIVNDAGRVLATINAGGITAADFLINKDGKVTSITADISGLKTKVDTLGLPESLSNSNTAFGRIKQLEEKTHNISVNGDETIIGRLKIDENDGVSVVVNANALTAGIGIFANNITKPFTSLTWQGLTVCDPRETGTTETSITANKISTTGTISANEVETNNWSVGGEEFLFTDGTEQNNVIAKIDANGITTTNLNAKKIYINSRDLASTIPVMASGKIPQSTTTAIKGQSGTNRKALTFDFMPHTIILFKEPEVTNSVDAKSSQLPIIWTKVKDDPMGYKDFVSYNLNGSTGSKAVEGSLEWGQNYVAWTSSFEDSAIPTGATCTFSSNLFCDGTYYYIAYGNTLSEDGNKLSTPITTLTQTNMW